MHPAACWTHRDPISGHSLEISLTSIQLFSVFLAAQQDWHAWLYSSCPGPTIAQNWRAHLIELPGDSPTTPAQVLHIQSQSNSPSPGIWLGDTAAQSHVVCDHELFTTYTSTCDTWSNRQGRWHLSGLWTRNGQSLISEQTHFFPVILTDFLHVPNIDDNLICLGRLTDYDMTYFSKGNTITICKNSKPVCLGTKHEHVVPVQRPTLFPLSVPRSWYNWHQILGHLNITQLQELYRTKLAIGMNIDESSPVQSPVNIASKRSMPLPPSPRYLSPPLTTATSQTYSILMSEEKLR